MKTDDELYELFSDARAEVHNILDDIRDASLLAVGARDAQPFRDTKLYAAKRRETRKLAKELRKALKRMHKTLDDYNAHPESIEVGIAYDARYDRRDQKFTTDFKAAA